jgi:cytochrome bd-type quinol oxidase subunit 2
VLIAPISWYPVLLGFVNWSLFPLLGANYFKRKKKKEKEKKKDFQRIQSLFKVLIAPIYWYPFLLGFVNGHYFNHLWYFYSSASPLAPYHCSFSSLLFFKKSDIK